MKRPFRVFIWILTLTLVLPLLGGCSGNRLSVVYSPVVEDLAVKPRLGASQITRQDEATLIAGKYCKLGTVTVSYRLAGDKAVKVSDRILKRLLEEGGRRGGDLVRIPREYQNVKTVKKASRNGSCLRSHDFLVKVPAPDVFYGPDGDAIVAQWAGSCDEFEQVTVFITTLTTTGEVWRHDPDFCSTLTTERAAARISELIRPGEGIGSISLGMTAIQVVSLLGRPRVSLDDELTFPKRGLDFLLEDGHVWAVIAYSGRSGGSGEEDYHQYSGSMSNGLNLNSGYSDVIKVLGKPDESYDYGTLIEILYYSGISFQFIKDSGELIYIRVTTSEKR